MSASAHPILIELSNQLPQFAHTYQYIQKASDFEEIAAQAQKIFRVLKIWRDV